MRKKILVVDDEPDLLSLETVRLQKAGYDVIAANNGREAMALIEKIIPDLVLLDLNLPLISGSDVCKQIKLNATLRHIPVILFTATFRDEILEKMRESRADGFLLKPFEPEELLEKIDKLIRKRKIVQKRDILTASYNWNEKQRLRL